MDVIPIFDLQRALEPALGTNGAREQIWKALCNGDVQAHCQKFVGTNAKAFVQDDYPDHADDFALPANFWGHPTWVNDGERLLSDRRPQDRWFTMTSWARGEFAISGSYSHGQLPFTRRAIGVVVSRSDAEAFLAKFAVELESTGGKRRSLRSTADLISEEERDAWIRAYRGRNSTKAWKAYRQEFGEAGGTREHDFHPAWMRIHGNPSRGAAKRPNPGPI